MSNFEEINGHPMNKEHFSKAAEAELKLNNALVNANISDGYEQYLALFDRFYDENIDIVREMEGEEAVRRGLIEELLMLGSDALRGFDL
jgi:hypothetical protein